MSENSKEKYILKCEDIYQTTLDFEKLSSWMDPVTNLPVRGFLSLYEACGLVSKIKEYSASHEDLQFVSIDNIVCNFTTLQAIRNFLAKQWGVYSIDIDGDNHVFWNTKTYPAGTKHYARSLKKKVKASLTQDFMNYGCGTDEELEDNVIIFRVFTKEPVKEEKEDSVNEEKK